MKTILLTILSLCCISNVFSQEEDAIEYTRKASPTDSLRIVEFLKNVHHVELCELGLTCIIDTIYDKNKLGLKAIKSCHLSGAIKNQQIDFDKITRRKVIRHKGLFRFLIKAMNNQSNAITLCYNPRNAILFYNDQDEVISYLEICFECDHVRWLYPFGLTRFTTNQLLYLRRLFNKNGLKTK